MYEADHIMIIVFCLPPPDPGHGAKLGCPRVFGSFDLHEAHGRPLDCLRKRLCSASFSFDLISGSTNWAGMMRAVMTHLDQPPREPL
jgi:hypothetical protein